MKILKKTMIALLLIVLTILVVISVDKIFESKKETPNNLPQNPIKETIPEDKEKTEKERAILLFSENINLEQMRDKYNNKEILARLEIPSLFNILVTKTTNNEYYLNHSIERKVDAKGSEYFDYRTLPTDKQVNIYGHNSSTYNIPFRKLENFLKEDFFNNNPYILLQHDEGTRIYKIFSIKKITTDYEHMKIVSNEDEFINHINKLKNNSLYTREVPYDMNSNILILQTCSYETTEEKSYYIISAIELE